MCNYCAGWVRQEEGQPLALSRDQVAALPPRLRRMVGYGVYKGLIGHVDQVDPGSWFPDGDDHRHDLGPHALSAEAEGARHRPSGMRPAR